jgi:hypothetical protein
MMPLLLPESVVVTMAVTRHPDPLNPWMMRDGPARPPIATIRGTPGDGVWVTMQP